MWRNSVYDDLVNCGPMVVRTSEVMCSDDTDGTGTGRDGAARPPVIRRRVTDQHDGTERDRRLLIRPPAAGRPTTGPAGGDSARTSVTLDLISGALSQSGVARGV